MKHAELRRDDALEACKILAFDGEDALALQDKLQNCLKQQLTRCDVCIREYHRSRTLLLASLEADYTLDEVNAFMMKFDAMNISRITAGLDNMRLTLMDLPPENRSIISAGEASMYALFEALNCMPFLMDELVMQQHFDTPFRLVQTKKKVKLPSYVPGMGAFLFSKNADRYAWAVRNVSQIKRPLLGTEFDYCFKPFLETAMARVNIISLEFGFLPIFWRGTCTILKKLSKSLITNQLRAMDANLFTLSLEHFQIDSSHFIDLIESYQMLLDFSPTDFWDAMGSASPQSVIETICRSPVLERLLKTTEDEKSTDLDKSMAWVETFVRSIKPTNVVPPLRTLLDQLLHRFQDDQYTKGARKLTWEKGLACLFQSIATVMKSIDGGPVYTHLIEVVAKDHIKVILHELDGIETKKEMQISRTELLDLDIIENVLALDVRSLARDRRIILGTHQLDHEIGISSLNTWKMSIRHVKPGHPALVISILSGIVGLLPLEHISTVQAKVAPRQAEMWNSALDRVLDYLETDFLERLELFSSDHLAELFQDLKAAQGIMALLFNGHERIHNPALGILKTISGEDSRRDSIMHVVKVFFTITLTAVANSLRILHEKKVFTPCAVALKLCSDIINCLCDSQDGILRSKVLSTDEEVRALNKFWETLWVFLETIFEKTEAWSSEGHDKNKMQDFCRETMDLADYAFDQYSIFANALQEASAKQGTTDISTGLLQLPNKAFRSITKWLRLRDEYLITKAVGLASKMLGRLERVGVKISDDSAQFLQDVATSTEKNAKVKTKLSMNQKAEVQSALEKHLGIYYQESLIQSASAASNSAAQKKQGSLQAWAASGHSSGSSTPASGKTPQGSIDVDAWSEAAKRKKANETSLNNEFKNLIESSSLASREYKKTFPAKKTIGPATIKTVQKHHQEEQKNFLAKRQQSKAEQEKQRLAALAKANKASLGAGSGVVGLGNLGADHSLKGQSVMVSSDDESDDEDDLDDDLFGTKPKERKRIALPNVDPNGAIGLKPEQKSGPTRIHRTARSAKDMRARLAPDLTPLHRIILNWDFFYVGDYPPNAHAEQFSQVADSFKDPTTYQTTFEQLLVLEAWQGIVKSRDENSSKPYEIKVQNRSNVDSFIEISSILGHAENRDLQVQEGDIILLSNARKPLNDATAPNCLARVYRLKRQKAHLEVIYQIMPGTALAPHLSMQAIVYGVKIQSIIPLEREYGALKALPYYDLCNHIIWAKPSRRINFSEKQIATYQDIWNVNKAQSEAINAALENEGFSLIQGPPGSGKTKTIVAIVGGLLSQTLNNPATGATKISMPKGSGNRNVAGDAPARKLLVCAPSNAAVDELVMRLKEGVKTKNGNHHEINVVRIGRSDAINSQVLDVTMDELVAKKLGNNENDSKMREKRTEVFKEHEQVSAQLRDLYQRRDVGDAKGKDLADLESAIVNVRKRKHELSVRIDNAKDQERNAGREAELNRKKAQQAVLDQAHVICATLSGSGHDMFQSLNIEFETVIIDEAAQCVEMSSLIPLKYGCVKCVMVGDPKQLPPTVFSKEAAKFQYEQSLFVRMQNNFAGEVHLLDTQYRMHPAISAFPSRTFYDGLLKDGEGMANLRRRPWHSSALLAPYRFYDVSGQHRAAPKGHSLINSAEIEVAMALYDRLTSDFTTYDFSGRVGIITPYKSQLKALKDKFSGRYGSSITDMIEFNTTDAFQGRESEVIIFSCVRASPAGGIGFLQDIRRMNVGLTRAKSSLWVLGNSDSLIRGQYWKKLVEDARARDCYTTGNLMTMLSKPSSKFPASDANDRSMLDVGSRTSQMHAGDSSRPGSTNGSRPLPPTAPTTGLVKEQHESSSVQRNDTQDVDRMEGIWYRFEDRIAKTKKRPSSEAGSERSRYRSDPVSEDVEMGDTDTASGSVTPANGVALEGNRVESRGGTPLSADGSHGTAADHSVKARPSQPIPPGPTTIIRKKRPAASPFMPKKPRP